MIQVIGGFQDTRSNEEDFALTPYVSVVYENEEFLQIFGFGICWGYYAVWIGLAKKIPEGFTRFSVINKENRGE